MCLLLAKVCPSSSSGYQGKQPLKGRETFMNPSTSQAGMWTPSYSRCSCALKPTRARVIFTLNPQPREFCSAFPVKYPAEWILKQWQEGHSDIPKCEKYIAYFTNRPFFFFFFFFPRAARNSLDTPGEKTARCWSIPEKRWPHGLWLCVMASGASPAAMSQPQLQGKQGLTSSPKCS